MSDSPTSAIRAWVNSRPDLVGASANGPLGAGAYLRTQASPQSGAYAVLEAIPAGPDFSVAEDGSVLTVRVGASVYAGTEQAAELGAKAYRDAVRSLTGCPVPVGDGWVIRVSDNVTVPAFQPAAPNTGEEFSFFVSADFVLTGS
jgi:hypothetical protein